MICLLSSYILFILLNIYFMIVSSLLNLFMKYNLLLTLMSYFYFSQTVLIWFVFILNLLLFLFYFGFWTHFSDFSLFCFLLVFPPILSLLYLFSFSGTDVDECVEGQPCGYGAQCVNRAQGFQCVCPPGYGGDPHRFCSPSQVRCVTDGDCTANEKCVQPGECVCPPPYFTDATDNNKCKSE